MKSFLFALPFILAIQREAAAFLGISSHRAVQLRAPIGTASVHTQVYPKDTRRSLRPLMLSAVEDGESDKKIEGRKKRVIIGYKVMMLSYLAVGLSSVVRSGGVSASLFNVIAGYIIMPAGISYIMSGAASHDRLNSDTYKRLNLALLEYGIVGLSILSLGGFKRPVMTLAFALTVINSIKGYAYGVLGWDKKSTETTLLKDITKGTKDTIKGFLSVPKNFNSFGYLVATYMVASMKLLKLKEVVEFIQANSIAEGLAMPLSRFNRLAFLTLMIYTLKDAADRDRLSGTTFIQMNYLCSLAMGVNYFFYTSGIATPLGALAAFFSAFFAFNGIISQFS